MRLLPRMLSEMRVVAAVGDGNHHRDQVRNRLVNDLLFSAGFTANKATSLSVSRTPTESFRAFHTFFLGGGGLFRYEVVQEECCHE